MTPLRKGMLELRVKMKDSFGSWLGGLGRALGVKGREASREASAIERPAPRDEAEEALWQAMGWDEPQGEDAGKVAARAVEEVLK